MQTKTNALNPYKMVMTFAWLISGTPTNAKSEPDYGFGKGVCGGSAMVNVIVYRLSISILPYRTCISDL